MGVSTECIDDVSEIMWGVIGDAGNKPLERTYPYICADDIYLKQSWSGRVLARVPSWFRCMMTGSKWSFRPYPDITLPNE